MKTILLLITTLFSLTTLAQTHPPIFDMPAIRDASTLNIEIVQDWHTVPGPVPTRQKIVTINVGEFWPGQNHRMPVRLIVPANSKAVGFHLTGGNTPQRILKDYNPNPLDQTLLRNNVGLVQTIVQVLKQSGLDELANASEARFAKSLNPHDKIQYWAWPATLMRAITTAHAETAHFTPGKVAMSGGSKNGATPSMAIIHDKRMTAVHASVSPIWDSPLRLCDTDAWDKLTAEHGPIKHTFLGGHFGPIHNPAALAAGRTWQDLQTFAANYSDDVFITSNITALRARNVDMLFHPGTHDMVAFDLAWGGAHHPTIPVYLAPNSGHGHKTKHPGAARNDQNKAAFLLNHFFDDVAPLLPSPSITHNIKDNTLTVTVQFPKNAHEETGRIFWIYNRPQDGSPGYLKDLIPNENFADMTHNKNANTWSAKIPLDKNATHIDVFTNHRKTITHQNKTYPTYIASPYTRIQLN